MHSTRQQVRQAILVLSVCLVGGLAAQEIEPGVLRAAAGESRTALWRVGGPLTAIMSTRTTPALEYPPLVELTAGGSEVRLTTPPATPPGEYTVEVTGRNAEGRTLSAALRLEVGWVTVERTATSRTPVVLLNGFQLVCTDTASTLAASEDTFGELATLLQNDGAPVLYFNNCAYGDISIEQLAAQLGAYIASLQYSDGTTVAQVDLVTHSMGGLIARAYLAGKGQVSGVFSPPASPKVRKLVAIATPNFGSFQASYIGAQDSEMARGNQFLWDLSTWNQGRDDLRGVDALAIIGNAGTYGTVNNASDGVVSLTSASLGFVAPDQRTRIVPYCHITPFTGSSLGMSCTQARGIADIDSASHLSAQIVRSFLADTTAWQSIGTPPSADPFLSIYGGALVALKGTNDAYFTDLTAVQADNGAISLMSGPSVSVASIFYGEFVRGGSYSFAMTHANDQVSTGTGSVVDGAGISLLFKFGPIITGVQSAVSTGLSGIMVASGSTIYVHGAGFSGTGLRLTANGVGLSISSSTDQQITAYLPGGYSGLVALHVSNSNGQHTVNIMTAPPSTVPQITGVVVSGGGATIAQNTWVEIYGASLAPPSVGTGGLTWSTASSFASGQMPSQLQGVSVTVNGKPAYIYYISSTQVNVLTPLDSTTGPVAVTVNNGSAVGTPFTVNMQPVAPGFLRFGDGIHIAAMHANYSLLGPASLSAPGYTFTPAAPNETILLFSDGFGLPVSTLMPGSAVQTGALPTPWPQITIGGTTATVQYAGLISPGLYQINVVMPSNAANGDNQVIATYDGASSPTGAMISVSR